MSNIVLKQVGTLATKFGLEVEARELVDVLKQTAFRGQVSDAQMSALLIVANQYGLNPWTKEIYAFPDQNNGIVPVVGVDGWARIINEHPQFDGIEFEQNDEACTCIMYRKDRTRPIRVTEYMAECKRETKPWKSHPKRMLRHKALIQCARLAFGFVGIYDEDEAERITERNMGTAEVVGSAQPQAGAASTAEVLLPLYEDDKFASMLPTWEKLVKEGKKTADAIGATLSAKHRLTEEQAKQIRNLGKSADAPAADSTVIDGSIEELATPEQIADLRKDAYELALSDSDLCSQFNLETLDKLPARLLADVRAFISGE